MGNLSLKQAAELCGGSIAPEAEQITFSGVCNDTRELEPGELFLALKDKRDGHAFAPAAMEKGAAAVLGEHPIDGIPVLVAAEPLRALAQIAAGWRRMLSAKVIGITGSVGKTTTKEMTSAVLQTTFRTGKSLKNYNNDIGVPRSLLKLTPDCEAAVLEMGMSHFGDMSRLTAMVQPDIAVITNIGTMHIEYLGSREGILKAKLEILEGMQPDGLVIANGDEPLLRNAGIDRKTLFFGIDTPCDLQATQVRTYPGGVSFRATGLGCDFAVQLPAEGRHHVYDALAAIAVGAVCGVSEENMAKALAAFQNTGDRQKIFRRNGFTIIADCYNAGPESMDAALEVLGARPEPGRRIAVLGDMLELGVCAQAAHYRLGQHAADKADMVFAYGENSRRVVAGAADNGMPAENARAYDSQELLVADLRRNARAGDVLLFKGSHGMHMEKAMERFLETEKESTEDVKV